MTRLLEIRPVRGERTNLGKGSDRRRAGACLRAIVSGSNDRQVFRRRKASRQLSTAARSRSVSGSLVAGLPVMSLPACWQCPGFGITWQGVSLADRVHDCVVRARATDCEDRQQKVPFHGHSVEPASAMSKGARGHIATE